MDPIVQPKNQEKFTQFEFKQISRKISNINKRMLNCDIIEPDLVKLEKDVLRGCATEREKPKPCKKQLRKQSYLSLILKSEHKISENACILKLPKMPFGVHKSYNGDSNFASRHFINASLDLSSEQKNELVEVTKKFRLDEKRKGCLRRNKTGYNKSRFLNNSEVFQMEHGQLVCKKEESVVKGYVSDKQKYHKHIYEPLTRPYTVKNADKAQQQQSIDRLHSSPKTHNSKLSQFFTSKYINLFSKSPHQHAFLTTSQRTNNKSK